MIINPPEEYPKYSYFIDLGKDELAVGFCLIDGKTFKGNVLFSHDNEHRCRSDSQWYCNLTALQANEDCIFLYVPSKPINPFKPLKQPMPSYSEFMDVIYEHRPDYFNRYGPDPKCYGKVLC